MIYSFCKVIILMWVKVFYRHKVYGEENIVSGGALIAPNHCSFLDPIVVGASCKGNIHYLARETLFRPPLDWLIRKLNAHPVNPGKGNLSTLKMAMSLVQTGKKVLIFPEGKRSTDGILLEGQLGVGMLVQKTKCRIIPVYTHGTYDIWNKGQKFPKLSGHTACVFGTPIEYWENEGEDKKEAQARIVKTIMAKIAALRDWYLAGAKGTPP